MPLNTRVTILKVAAAALLIGPGLIMVAALAIPALMSWVNTFVDFAHQPLDGQQELASEAAYLLNAILGGIIVGFGAMVWLVAERVYRHDPALGRGLIMMPLLSWFVCDSAGSVLAGAWFNAVLNSGLLAVFLVPLALPLSPTEGRQQAAV